MEAKEPNEQNNSGEEENNQDNNSQNDEENEQNEQISNDLLQHADNKVMESSKVESKMAESKVISEKPLGNSKVSQSKQELWKAYDFLFPGGKLAKLIKIFNIYKNNLPIREMLDKFKFTERYPVVNLIGAMEKGRGKFYAGVVRAAFNTDAVIVDNGLASGIERFALRRGVKFIGIAPENEIKFPKINPTNVDPFELANGHTHLFLVNNPTKDLHWGGEVSFKINTCLALANGKNKNPSLERCKIVSLVMGDASFDIIEEIKLCVDNEIPLIVVPGSTIAQEIVKISEGESGKNELHDLVKRGHFFYCNSTNSEDIAQLTHLLLSIRPW